MYRSLGSLSVLFGQVVRGLSAGGRVFEFLELQPRVALHGGVALPVNSVKGAISFENVTFAYPTRPDQVRSGILQTEKLVYSEWPSLLTP